MHSNLLWTLPRISLPSPCLPFYECIIRMTSSPLTLKFQNYKRENHILQITEEHGADNTHSVYSSTFSICTISVHCICTIFRYGRMGSPSKKLRPLRPEDQVPLCQFRAHFRRLELSSKFRERDKFSTAGWHPTKRTFHKFKCQPAQNYIFGRGLCRNFSK